MTLDPFAIARSGVLALVGLIACSDGVSEKRDAGANGTLVDGVCRMEASAETWAACPGSYPSSLAEVARLCSGAVGLAWPSSPYLVSQVIGGPCGRQLSILQPGGLSALQCFYDPGGRKLVGLVSSTDYTAYCNLKSLSFSAGVVDDPRCQITKRDWSCADLSADAGTDGATGAAD